MIHGLPGHSSCFKKDLQIQSETDLNYKAYAYNTSVYTSLLDKENLKYKKEMMVQYKIWKKISSPQIEKFAVLLAFNWKITCTPVA